MSAGTRSGTSPTWRSSWRTSSTGRARSPAPEPTPRCTGPATRVSRRETPRRSSQSARRRIRARPACQGHHGRLGCARDVRAPPFPRARPVIRRLRNTPVSDPPDAPPTEKVRWPNVTLSQLPRFEESLDRWFKRRGIPIWITEYGYQTKPGDRFGVTEAQQARYLSQVMSQLKADQRVQMFIWFIFRDSKRGHWQSGLRSASGRRSPPTRPSHARALHAWGDAVDQPGRQADDQAPRPTARVRVSRRLDHRRHLPRLSRHEDGRGGRAAPRLQTNQSVSFVANFTPVWREEYTIEMDAGDISGNDVFATFNLLTAAPPSAGTTTLSGTRSCASSPKSPRPARRSRLC